LLTFNAITNNAVTTATTGFTIRANAETSLQIGQINANAGSFTYLGRDNFDAAQLTALNVSSGISMGNGTIGINSLADYSLGLITNSSGGTLRLTNAATAQTRTATVTGLTGSGGTLTIQADDTSKADVATLLINNTSDYASNAVLSNGGALNSLALSKQGSGTQTLTGNSTYSGGTTVSAGTLLVDGAHTGAGAYNVSAGTLGGTGSITTALNAGITFANGAALSPGDNSASNFSAALGSGVFDISAMATNSKLLFTLDTVGGSDKVTLTTGTLSVGTLNSSEFAFTLGGGIGAGTYTLFDTNSAINYTSLDTASFALNGSYNGSLQFANGTQDIQLIVSAVPEPSTWALLAFSLMTVMVLRRRTA